MNSNVRGNRSKFIECICYDLETDSRVFKQVDITQPFNRFIPEWLIEEWLNKKSQLKLLF